MDLYTAFKFNFTFDVWIAIPGQAPDTFIDKYYKSYIGLLVPGSSQTYLYTKEEVPWLGSVRNMKDPSGTLVFEEFGEDFERFIVSSEPVFNYQGNVNGYRSVLRREKPGQPIGGSH